MSSGETIMVASTFEPVKVGQAYESMPEHMTWASWFNLPDDRQEDFAFLLEEIVEENRPPRITAGSIETFGDETLGFSSVRRFDRATSGFNVIQDFFAQAALYGFITNVDPDFDPTYFGLNWNPHTKRKMENEEAWQVNNLVAFKKEPEHHLKVVRNVVLWEETQA